MSCNAEPSGTVTEAQIARMVRLFYDQARADPELGPLFDASVSDWEHHLTIVQDFWSHALLRSGRYRGHPYPVHTGLGIRREHFGRWLVLLRQAAQKTLPDDASARAIAQAEHMTEAFKAGLFPFDHPPRAAHG